MKIWNGFGSEHSMDLVLIGRFRTVAAAVAAEEGMTDLQELAGEPWSDDDWRSPDERMPREMGEALREMGLYDMGRFDVDNFAFDHQVTRAQETIRIWTDESEVQGFLKLLLHHGAKVEVFSRHQWDEKSGQPADVNDRSDSGAD